MLSALRDIAAALADAAPLEPVPLTNAEFSIVQQAIDGYVEALRAHRLKLHVLRDFERYVAVRHAHGDHHLNQAFDPRHARIGERDFWLLIESPDDAPIATFCMRTLAVANIYTTIQNQSLWFGIKPRLVDPDFDLVCTIPPFGGRVAHGGGLWIRPDYRGPAGMAQMLPRLARALALRNNDVDHDSAMLLNSANPAHAAKVHKRAAAMIRTYGFARGAPLVDGWFPPEQCRAIVHLCHSTRAEAVASLVKAVPLSIAA